MYCLLTRRSINRRQDEVMRHLGGVRFFKRYDDHMRKAELGTNGVGEQHETRMDEAEGMHVDDAAPDGDDELWVPPEYTKLERKSKSTKVRLPTVNQFGIIFLLGTARVSAALSMLETCYRACK
jgi:hypothetical protein